MTPPRVTAPRSVLVVGASSGIGLATALRFAAAGAALTLTARDATALADAAAACTAAGAAEVSVQVGDVNSATEMTRVVTAARAVTGTLDVVVHTATVMAYGTVRDLPADVFTTVVDTAVHGTLHLARATLEVFCAQHRGTLIVVNSLLGSVTVPTMGAYATAKWGQRALARTLQQELQGQPDIHVCIVSPGSTNTPIYYQAANYLGRPARPPFPVLQPERTATAIVELADRPRNHVSIPVGPPNPLIVAGYRLVPFVYDRLVGPLFRLTALTGKPGKQAPTTGNVHDAKPELERVHGHWPAP